MSLVCGDPRSYPSVAIFVLNESEALLFLKEVVEMDGVGGRDSKDEGNLSLELAGILSGEGDTFN